MVDGWTRVNRTSSPSHCGILPRNKSWPSPVRTDGIGGSAGFRVKNISSDPAESLVQYGFCESGLRKILLSKNLNTKILRTKRLAVRVSLSADRHCLDHDRASSMAGTRSDVTRGLWKSARSRIQRDYSRGIPLSGETAWALVGSMQGWARPPEWGTCRLSKFPPGFSCHRKVSM
jgi:hypothetical protein